MGFFSFKKEEDTTAMVFIGYGKIKTVDDMKILLQATYPNTQFDLNSNKGEQLGKFKKDDNE